VRATRKREHLPGAAIPCQNDRVRGWALAGLGALVAAGTGAWLLLGRGAPEGPVSPVGRAANPAAPAGPAGTAAPVPLRPRPGGVLEGIVLRDGSPAAATVGARLLRRGPSDPDSWEAWQGLRYRPDLLDGLDESPRAEAAAGPDGKWSFRGLGPGEFLFEAQAADGWRGRATAILGSDGSPVPGQEACARPLRIVLRPGTCVLRGRATNLDGSPFGGLVLARKRDDLLLPARPDAEGRFLFDGLPAATVRLSALVPGVREVPGPVVILPTDAEVSFLVGAGMDTVEGRLVEDATGTPVAGAPLTLRFGGNWPQGSELLRTDRDGRFALPFAGGWTIVVAEVPGFLPRQETFEDPGPGLRRPVVLRLRRLAALSGRVLTAEGAPAAEAEVEVTPEAHVPGRPDRGRRATADASGRYALEALPPGPAVVLVKGGGFVSRSLLGPAPWSRTVDTVLLIEGNPATRDIVAVPCARARGRAVDAEGRGLAQARVRFWQVNPTSDEGCAWGEVPADAEGAFAVPYLLPGAATKYTAFSDGRFRAVGEGLPLPPGAEGEVLLRAPADRTVAVRVEEDGSGRPVAGAWLRVGERFPGHEEGRGAHREEEWVTGADGTARVGPVPAVPLVLWCFGKDPGWWGGQVEVGDSDTGPVVLEVDPLRLPGTLTLEGRVLLPDGSPAIGAGVGCTTVEAWAGSPHRGEGVPTDATGRFRVTDLHPARYAVEASLSQFGHHFKGRAEAEAGARDVVVALRDESQAMAGLDADDGRPRFRVRVLGPSRKPVASGQVAVHFIGSGYGRYSPGNLPLCDGLAAAPVPEGKGGASAWVEVLRAIDAEDPDLRLAHGIFGPFPATAGEEVEVVLSPGLTVEGRVVDGQGRGVPLASVSLRIRGGIPAPDREIWGEWGGHAVADAEGRFRVEGVGDRDYDLQASSWPGWCPSEGVTVRGGTKGATLVLRPAVSVLVTVLDPGGNPLPKASVEVQGRGSAGVGQTNGAGMARLEGLDPARPEVLLVRAPGDLLPETREGWMPADTVVRFRAGLTLEVLVQDPSGRPVPGALVIFRREESAHREERRLTDATGIARFAQLVPGRVSLRAQLPEDVVRDSRSEEVVADAASGRVTLDLDPGLEIRAVVRDGGKPAHGKVSLAVAGEERVCRSAAPVDGEIRFRGLRAGVDYDLYASGEKGGAAVLRGLRAGGDPLEVDLGPAGEISGKVLLPDGGEFGGVHLLVGKASMGRAERWQPDGTFVLSHVPAGRWTVRAQVWVGGKKVDRLAEAEAGGSVEIDAR